MRLDEGDEGGTKFLKANGMEVRGNYVHHNYGNGLWTDHENVNILYEDNIVEYNEGAGIFHEISWDAVIRNNTLKDNSAGDGRSLFYGAQIYLNNSKNTEIYGNYIEGPYHAIGIFGSDRGTGLFGPFETKNVKVYNNEIHMWGQARTGAVGWDYVTDPLSGNEFYDNDYYTPDDGTYWRWGSDTVDWSGWQAFGNDTDGSRTIQ